MKFIVSVELDEHEVEKFGEEVLTAENFRFVIGKVAKWVTSKAIKEARA